MTETDEFWEFYWESRLTSMENLGKRFAILAASRLIRSLSTKAGRPLRLLELGCGEGQILGTLVDAHFQLCDDRASTGVDYNALSLLRCRQSFPGIHWVEGDFTDFNLLGQLGKFDIVLLVNALHEVFSKEYSSKSGELDVPLNKQRVEEVFSGIIGCLAPGGWLVLFDGVEPPGNPGQKLNIEFLDSQAWEEFDRFVRQYRPFHITYREIDPGRTVELSQHDFARYITKSIFVEKNLWDQERFESYQYFSEAEFREVFARQGLEILELVTLTVNGEKWRRRVAIKTPADEFPPEHILILARIVPQALDD